MKTTYHFRPKSSERHICRFWPIWLSLIPSIGWYNRRWLSKKKSKIFKNWPKFEAYKIFERGNCAWKLWYAHFDRTILKPAGKCVKRADIDIWKRHMCLCDPTGHYAQIANINIWKRQLCSSTAQVPQFVFYLCCRSWMCTLSTAYL